MQILQETAGYFVGFTIASQKTTELIVFFAKIENLFPGENCKKQFFRMHSGSTALRPLPIIFNFSGDYVEPWIIVK